jgi:hypothetical protein
VTTSSNRDGSRRKARGSASRQASSARSSRKPAERPKRQLIEEQPPPEPVALPPPQEVVEDSEPLLFSVAPIEREFVARVPPPEPERPRPPGRRAIFLDVENTSRAQHLAHVIDHLGVDPWDRRTELVAVANWRVVGHEAARLLAARGAHLVHSAPSTGVRDWSDLRIAVDAGIWLAAARPGDLIEIVSDDRAFDAVGDVAASLGIEFRRLSYRRLREGAGQPVAEPEEPLVMASSSSGSGSRRRRRRRGRGQGGPQAAQGSDRRPAEERGGHRAPTGSGHQPSGRRRQGPSHSPRPQPAEGAHTTAPHDELVSVVRGLVESSPKRSVSIDAVANALKARGFQRPPGSPRLVTRLRRIREIVVSPSGTITMADDNAPPPTIESQAGSAPHIERESWSPSTPIEEELDEDRQPDFLRRPDEAELPEVDGNRADPPPAAATPPSRSGRRRRRRRWRGGPRQPAPGSQPV